MIIGNFNYNADQDSYCGNIRTLTANRAGVQLLPLRKVNEREPDYRVLEKTDAGVIEYGAAWKRRSDKGQSFLSILLDDPALSQPINVAMFPDRDGTATLVWTRPRSKAADPEPDAPKARRSTPARAAGLG